MRKRAIGILGVGLLAAGVLAGRAAVAEPMLAGHWVSPEHVTFTNPAKAGSAFYLDITVSADGRFTGTWDSYLCTSFPGAYGSMIISCGRAKTPARAQGRLNVPARTGDIDLEKLGKSSFALTAAADGGTLGTLVIDLPAGWLKEKEAILQTSRLTRK